MVENEELMKQLKMRVKYCQHLEELLFDVPDKTNQYLKYASDFLEDKGLLFEFLTYIEEKEGVVENDKETSNKLLRELH